MLVPYVEKLRQAGVEFGINMMYTVGHCFYAGEAGFKRAVTINGAESDGCGCISGLWQFLQRIMRAIFNFLHIKI